jgi:hypothetical protein
MFATVSAVFDEFAFGTSDHPLPDTSRARSNDTIETREVFIHRRAMLNGIDRRKMRRGARVRVQKVVIEHGRGLRAEGVEVVN